jgi:hypothetical protein
MLCLCSVPFFIDKIQNHSFLRLSLNHKICMSSIYYVIIAGGEPYTDSPQRPVGAVLFLLQEDP